MKLFEQANILRPGSPAPDFTLLDQQDQPVRLANLLKRGWVVLFFYPKDHSPVCTQEVCAFRNAYADFKLADAEVVGISADSTDSHQKFANRHQLSYPLLSDPGGQVRASYGIRNTLGILPGRVTFVIDPHGIIRLAHSAMTDADSHIEQALQSLQKQEA